MSHDLRDAGKGPKLILVHGLWFRAWSLRVLSDRLRREGFQVVRFSYPTTSRPLDASAEALHALCRQQDDDPLHLVGHSLGGLLILRMLHVTGWQRPGRILLLGSPLSGSGAARRAEQWPAADKLFGQAVEQLTEGVRHWPEERQVGMIAGTGVLIGWDSIGLGVLCTSLILVLYYSRRMPGALIVFALGLVVVLAADWSILSQTQLGMNWDMPRLGNLDDWRKGLQRAAIPQSCSKHADGQPPLFGDNKKGASDDKRGTLCRFPAANNPPADPPRQ